MKFRSTIGAMALLAAVLMLFTPALSAYSQVSDVISGGGQQVNSDNYILNGTVGQSSAIGLSISTNYSNHGGFWNLPTGDTLPPTTPLFTLLSPSRSYTVPITALTSTDIGSGVTGYYISASPTPPADPWGAGWAAPTPASLISATKGPNQIFFVWARDAAGNVSGGASASTDIIFQWLLSVAFGTTGGTSITSSPGSIACMAGNTGTCSESIDEGTLVTLTATPDVRSQSNSWTGADSYLYKTASVTMNMDRNVTANFETVPNVARIVYDRGYDSLLATIQALVSSSTSTIQARDIYPGTQTEALLINGTNTTVTLAGGMNANWDPTASFSTIKGTLKVSGTGNRLNVNNIKIKP
jgi:hypothetical protein